MTPLCRSSRHRHDEPSTHHNLATATTPPHAKMLTAMPLHKLEREVEKLDGYLAKFNRLMSEAPEEFRDAVEVAFIGMTDRFKIYEQALKKKSSVRRRDDSDSDSGDDDDGGHGRDLRASATPVSYSNKSK